MERTPLKHAPPRWQCAPGWGGRTSKHSDVRVEGSYAVEPFGWRGVQGRRACGCPLGGGGRAKGFVRPLRAWGRAPPPAPARTRLLPGAHARPAAPALSAFVAACSVSGQPALSYSGHVSWRLAATAVDPQQVSPREPCSCASTLPDWTPHVTSEHSALSHPALAWPRSPVPGLQPSV